MSPDPDVLADLRHSWHWFAVEQRRAARAAEIAARYDAQAAMPPARMRDFRRRMAELHRGMEHRHIAAARLHAAHAMRLQRWSARADRPGGRPVFVGAVAEALRMDCAAVTLFGRGGTEGWISASDATARAAYDIEVFFGEGPAGDAAAGDTVVVSGEELRDRWPRFGPAVTELGIHALVAASLRSPTTCLGALTLFAVSPRLRQGIDAVTTEMAEVLTSEILLGAPEADGSAARASLFDEADGQAVVHQAAGIASVHFECGVDDAMALLRARAFVEGRTLTEIAHQVVHERRRLR